MMNYITQPRIVNPRLGHNLTRGMADSEGIVARATGLPADARRKTLIE
jgi:hypothetical protein